MPKSEEAIADLKTRLRTRHSVAMRVADTADYLLEIGNPHAGHAYAYAARLERRALKYAERIATLDDPYQPTRSALAESSAWLHLSAGDPRGLAIAQRYLDDPTTPERMRGKLEAAIDAYGF